MIRLRYEIKTSTTGLIIAGLLVVFGLALSSLPANAAEQEVIHQFVMLLNHPEGWDGWGKGVFDDATLVDGLTSLYEDCIEGDTDIPMGYILFAMGETGLVEFLELISDAIDEEPVSACFALGRLPSIEAVHTLIGLLEHENRHVRDIAVYSLGKYPHYPLFEGLQDEVVLALKSRLDAEEEEWIREDIQAAIVYIETGVAINAAFDDEDDRHG